MKEIIKRYTKDDLTVVWQPAKCSHSKKCFHGLSEVFNPNNRPWVQLDKSTAEEIVTQVKKCPSGALSFEGACAEAVIVEGIIEETLVDLTKVTVTKGGPLLVKGALKIELADGETVQKTGMTALCRCGASANKPYCDGSHQNIEFDS